MLRQENVQGHEALVLENESLRITVLPRKGADIYEFVHKQLGVDFLLKTPPGLRPPGDVAPKDFLDNYEGGWQELFPNTDSPCNYKGANLPFHGEVALLPWESVIQRDDLEETAVQLSVRCRETPFELQRLMRLPAAESTLQVEETVINHSKTPAEFVWGHHLVLGGNFLEEGCRVEIPAKTLNTREELYEPATACLSPGQRELWPHARRRGNDQWTDLSYVPGPEVHTHDEIFLTDLSKGQINVTNPRLQLRFSLDWDEKVFSWIVLWQPFGGSDEPPLKGIYGLGIEPWTSPGNLEQAVKDGESIRLGPGESLTTKLRASVCRV